MFNFFKKKSEVSVEPTVTVHAVAKGEVISIDKVEDPVFSQKFMGDGYAVQPTSSIITSPVSGTVLNVFPTKHAVGIKTDNGVEVLLHMGIDTVSLEGKPFDTVVQKGQRVTCDTVIATVDLEAIVQAGKQTTMIVVITNMDRVQSMQIRQGACQEKEAIGTVAVSI